MVGGNEKERIAVCFKFIWIHSRKFFKEVLSKNLDLLFPSISLLGSTIRTMLSFIVEFEVR